MAKPSSTGAMFWSCFAAAAAVGVAVEIGVAQTRHRREAWDSDSYWSIGLPVMLLAPLFCGFFARQRPVLVGYAPFLGQLIAMLAKTGGGSMLPLGVILMGFIGAVGVAAASVGGLLGNRLLGKLARTERR